MNRYVKNMIQAVANNDLQKAKAYVKVIVEGDTTQANADFCKRMMNLLQAPSSNLIELPSNVRDILYMENVAASFNERRYYLSQQEKIIEEDIAGMYATSQKLSEMGIHYLNSVMLHGESGAGKTVFGKFIAYKLGLPFVYMNFSHVISSYLGNTGKNIISAFDFIQNQKCVFMIDEIDAIGMKRGKEDVGEMARIVISLMQALDRTDAGCVIIGATNRLDMIDKALLRRFSIEHEVKFFSQKDRKAMIEKYLDDVKVKYDENDIDNYCCVQKSQADIVTDIAKSIAKSIRYDCPLRLSNDPFETNESTENKKGPSQ